MKNKATGRLSLSHRDFGSTQGIFNNLLILKIFIREPVRPRPALQRAGARGGGGRLEHGFFPAPPRLTPPVADSGRAVHGTEIIPAASSPFP
jgi:hypothetical protein